MSTQPVSSIHVLTKSNYSQHHLVTLPPSLFPPLPPSSIRLRPKILGLTTNNLTYARHGHLMGWYDIYPLPPHTPAPYNDSSTFGRIAARGYADIVESNVSGVETGKTVYGFLPISDSVETVTVKFAQHQGKKIPSQVVATDPHRQHLWKIYNRYQICPSLPTLESAHGLDSLGLDALMQGLFATGYNLSTYGFAWTPGARIHPSGEGDWNAEDADLKGAAVVILNASGKTGMSFAYALRHCRPVDSQPQLIVGVGSEKSIASITASSLYDAVFLNTGAASAKPLIESLHLRRAILLDFGARPEALPLWKFVLSASSIPFTLITVGGEVKIQDPEAAKKRLAMLGKTVLVNASLLREKGIEMSGDEYFRAFYQEWDAFKESIAGRSLKLEWGEGVEGWAKGWDKFCGDEVGADTGLVYRI